MEIDIEIISSETLYEFFRQKPGRRFGAGLEFFEIFLQFVLSWTVLRYPTTARGSSESIDWCHLKILSNRQHALLAFLKISFLWNNQQIVFFFENISKSILYDIQSVAMRSWSFLMLEKSSSRILIFHKCWFLNVSIGSEYFCISICFLFFVAFEISWITLRALPPVTRLTVQWRPEVIQ